MSSKTLSRQDLTDTRSKLDPTKSTSNSTDLDASDVANASSVEESVVPVASPAPTGVEASGASDKNDVSSDALIALIANSLALSEGTGQTLAASSNLPYHPGVIAKILAALTRGDDAADQQHISSVGVQAQPDTQVLICTEIEANRGRYLHSALTHQC